MSAGGLHRLVAAGWARRAQRLRRLLGRRVRLRRVGLDLQILLEPETPATTARPPVAPPVPEALPPPSANELAWMLDDLAEVLDRHPSARSVFPALVLVERALGRRRGPALERLPETVRQDAVVLLDRLDGVGAPPGLTLLRKRLRALDPTPEQPPSGPAVQVQEASLSVFLEADREWARQWEHRATTAPAPVNR